MKFPLCDLDELFYMGSICLILMCLALNVPFYKASLQCVIVLGRFTLCVCVWSVLTCNIMRFFSCQFERGVAQCIIAGEY